MVQPGSVAEAAGVKVGDQLLALGDIEIMDPSFGDAFRSRFGKSEGDSLSIRVRRGADTLTLHGTVQAVGAGREPTGRGPERERQGGEGPERHLQGHHGRAVRTLSRRLSLR